MIFGIEYGMAWNWIILLIGAFLVADVWARANDQGWKRRDRRDDY